MYPKSASTWRYPAGLLAAYGIIWFALAIDPVFRRDWLLENAIVFAAVPLLALTARRLRFSDFAYTCLFVFFVFHAVGAHYTYSLVPYADWWESLGGAALEGRNHYDRLVHFLYGLLVAPAAAELFAHYGRYARPWQFLFPWMFMAGHATLYELIEFAPPSFSAATSARLTSGPRVTSGTDRRTWRSRSPARRSRSSASARPAACRPVPPDPVRQKKRAGQTGPRTGRRDDLG